MQNNYFIILNNPVEHVPIPSDKTRVRIKYVSVINEGSNQYIFINIKNMGPHIFNYIRNYNLYLEASTDTLAIYESEKTDWYSIPSNLDSLIIEKYDENNTEVYTPINIELEFS